MESGDRRFFPGECAALLPDLKKPPGTWGEPVDAAQHRAKIRDCLGMRFDAAKCERVLEPFENLERLDANQVKELLALLA